ncbi:hypothetical protein ACFE04_015140 [Oxalis oulophora]
MARWDAILSLPVQSPPTPEFSAAQLVWSKIEGYSDNIDRLAKIPFTRVNDFLRGESTNQDFPTMLYCLSTRYDRKPTNKPKVDTDRRDVHPKKKNVGRPSTKMGCRCHFTVKRLAAEPSVALVIYNQDKHINTQGLPCHGPGTNAMFAPHFSEDFRLCVLSLLYTGFSVEAIMQIHNESVDKQGGPKNRDDLLTRKYVRRQERSIRRSTYELVPDDDASVSLWVESHQSSVFYYQDFSDSDSFTLGIQTEWQLQQMICFGNRSLVASDSRCGTNKLKYPIHSLTVFNQDNKAIPVAWIIALSFATADAHKWMRALNNRVRDKDPTWKLAGFIVDDPLADVLSIRGVFECSVLISSWRVRHAWHKNLLNWLRLRVGIARRLGLAVDNICRGHRNTDLFEDLMEDFVDASDFMDYFKATWYPTIDSWTTAFKSLPLASHETSAAMEFHHKQLNLSLLNERDSAVCQRIDWLVNKLGTKVHSFFWLDEHSEKAAFARYAADEWMSGLTCWRKALKILDSHVVIQGKCAKVADKDETYVVWNPGSHFGICSCKCAEMGHLCEHVFIVMKFCRQKGFGGPSVSLSEFNWALIDLLNCPAHDSLISDHAVSLAVSVYNQLTSLIDSESSHTHRGLFQEPIVDPTRQPNIGAGSFNYLMDVDPMLPSMNEDMDMIPEKGVEFGNEESFLIKEPTDVESVADDTIDHMS